MKNMSIDEVAKKKGLPEFSTNQLVDLIKIEMLYTIHKELDNVSVEKPDKPEKPTRPIEPIKPATPEKPTLTVLQGSSSEVEKINIEIYRTYQDDLKKYKDDVSLYDEKILSYHEKMNEYQDAVLSYGDNIKDYESKLVEYSKNVEAYEKFEFQKVLNQKIEQTYTGWTGKPWNKNMKSKMTYFMLIGPPGHGKTTVLRQAAKMVSENLGLVYKENPTVSEKVDRNSFVMFVNNLAGEVSKTGVSGLPAKVKDDKGNEYTGLLPSYAMSSLTQAGAGMLLLDDIANASSFIQNIALPLTNENSFNELKLENVYVGITSNLGALDGTNTSTISSALRNRVKTVFVKDHIEDFIYRERRNEQYFDDIGDFFMTDFLENKKDDKEYLEDLFYSMPSKNDMGGFSNPRSIKATINELRRLIYDQGGLNEENENIINLTMQSTLGNRVGEDFFEYVKDVNYQIAPIIDNFFENNVLDKQKIDEKLDDVFSPKGKLFEYRFRKYLERKIRNEAFKIGAVSNKSVKTKMKNQLIDKIAHIYPILNDQQRSAFSASLREDVFLGNREFSDFSISTNSRECISDDFAKKLIKAIKVSSLDVIDNDTLKKQLTSILSGEDLSVKKKSNKANTFKR